MGPAEAGGGKVGAVPGDDLAGLIGDDRLLLAEAVEAPGDGLKVRGVVCPCVAGVEFQGPEGPGQGQQVGGDSVVL